MTTTKRKPSKAEIYALIDPRDGAIRYIGKANDSAKRLKSHMRDARRRRTPVYDWINMLAKQNLAPTIRVLEIADDWEEAERRIIATARASGERLLNLADGGDEPYCPPDVRAENGRRCASLRPKYLMIAYRTFEMHVRESRKITKPGHHENIAAKYERFKVSVARHRANGTLDWLDAQFRAYFQARGRA